MAVCIICDDFSHGFIWQEWRFIDRWRTHNDSWHAERANNKNTKKFPRLSYFLWFTVLSGKWMDLWQHAWRTYISGDVHRKFLHQFVMFGAMVLYPMSAPQTVVELRDCEKEHNIAGFPGCIGSTDATHIPLEKVCVSLRQVHLGFKSKRTMWTYNLTCNHCCQILHTTSGHTSRC